jgi:HK97 family phage portal protein
VKLFAPRNEWNVSAPRGGWFGDVGGAMTSSGVRVDERTAELFATVVTCTRVLSETLASLPCNVLARVDDRTSRRAMDHPLWSVLHDQPNPEQDIVAWMDSQVAFQMNWGNAYAEIQRDTLGQVVALWPIHPSRIPLKNIVRNGTSPDDYDGIVAGQPGEIVYYVDNDDGSKTPIPASDMLHVPGVLSTNGVTGQSLIRKGAGAIGIAIATEQHAGAIFRNGAVTNIALKSPKTRA